MANFLCAYVVCMFFASEACVSGEVFSLVSACVVCMGGLPVWRDSIYMQFVLVLPVRCTCVASFFFHFVNAHEAYSRG